MGSMAGRSTRSLAVMNQRVAFGIAAAIYLGIAVWTALAIAFWPFVPERPFVVSKAILGILVAAILAVLGIWSVQISRLKRHPTRLYTSLVAAPVVIFGALSGPRFIALFAIPAFFAVCGAWMHEKQQEAGKHDG